MQSVDLKMWKLNSRQVSMLDHLDLIGSADITIAANPELFAGFFGLKMERAIDDLGYFDFLAVTLDDKFIAFRKSINSKKPYSYVSHKGCDREYALELAREIAGPGLKFVLHDDGDRW
mgnify:CR=1 FL=1